MASDLPSPPTEGGVYPADRKDSPRWLTWKQADDGRKIPRAPYHNPNNHDQYVSAQDPTIWTNFENAVDWAEKLPHHQLAHVIPNRDDYDTDLVLVDYDNARDPETGEIHPTVHDHLKAADSYADISPSGTGVHILCRGELPDDVKTIADELPAHDAFPEAEIEVYDSARYLSTTGNHISGTPDETRPAQEFIDTLVDEYATVSDAVPDAAVSEPSKSRADLEDLDTTSDMEDIFDAIKQVRPRDIRLDSPVTEERSDGSKSRNPTWANSETGTRLAQLDEGWVYRDGLIGLDALQVVALEEGLITNETDYPKGDTFWDAVDALRHRGAHIPEYEPEDDDKDDEDDDRIPVRNERAMSPSDWTPADPNTRYPTTQPGTRTPATANRSAPEPSPSTPTSSSGGRNTEPSTREEADPLSTDSTETSSETQASKGSTTEDHAAPVDGQPNSDSPPSADEPSTSDEDTSTETQQLEEELDDVTSRLEVLQRALNTANEYIAELQTELKEEREERTQLEEENRDLQHALETDPETKAIIDSLDATTLSDLLDDETLALLLIEVAEEHTDESGKLDLTTLEVDAGPLARLASIIRSR